MKGRKSEHRAVPSPTTPDDNVGPEMARVRFSRSPILYGVRNPGKAVDYLTLWRRFRRAFKVETQTLRRWQRELVDDSGLPGQLQSKWEHVKGMPLTAYSGGSTIGPANEVLYCIVRALKPSLVVETGVASGFSTSYLLEGLKANGSGILHSVDLPTLNPDGLVNEDGRFDKVHVDRVEETGFVIPEDLRSFWRLHLGSSASVLPSLLSELGEIDLFWHDSDHSYANMMWEYRTAWRSLRPGGWIISDDTDWNSAFNDFEKEVDSRAFLWLGRGAIPRLKV